MKHYLPLALAAVCAGLSGCETTGDPQQGGLFGWSETQAKERQAQKQSAVAGAEAELARESGRTAAMNQRRATTDRQINTAETQRRLAVEQLRAQQAALIAKTERLDEDCPTAASGSRARARGHTLARKVNTIAAYPFLTVAQREERLRRVESEIDAARAQFNR